MSALREYMGQWRNRAEACGKRGIVLAAATLLAMAGALSLTAAPASAGGFSFLGLSVNSPHQVIGGTAVLTASSAYDVGPTPYYIEIFDQTTGARVAICGSGTSCSGSASYSYATTHTYVAYVARYGTTNRCRASTSTGWDRRS